jgi:DNA-directed RNA polymerase subunit H (RpoH/RPB5)
MEEAKNRFGHKRESLIGKRGELLANRADLHRQLLLLDDEIEELRRTTNKDEISDLYTALEGEIIRISRETAAGTAEQKNVSALDLLKDI